MPIYEYACAACGHPFERLMRIGAPAPACPACASAEVTRQLSVPAPTASTAEPVAAGCGRCGDPGGACPFRPQ